MVDTKYDIVEVAKEIVQIRNYLASCKPPTGCYLDLYEELKKEGYSEEACIELQNAGTTLTNEQRDCLTSRLLELERSLPLM